MLEHESQVGLIRQFDGCDFMLEAKQEIAEQDV